MSQPRGLAACLLFGIWAGLALILLTPFVVTSQTIFPFVVGKSLYARTLIELVFVLWVLLAILTQGAAKERPGGRRTGSESHSGYALPRSWLLALLAAGFGVSVLAACFGVSPQRSFWSNYERMEGVVDGLHWLAFAVVLASVLRSGREWRILLNLNLGASLAVALLAVCRYYEVGVPFFGELPERDWPRIATVLGNATYLGLYMLVNCLIALGFLARSFLTDAAEDSNGDRRRKQAATPPGRLLASLWLGRLFWGVAAGIPLWAFTLSGSFGSLVGLVAAIAFLVSCYAVLASSRLLRRIAIVAVVVVGLAVAAGVALFLTSRDGSDDESPTNPLAMQLAKASIEHPSARSRISAWEAGLKGAVDRPLLGWGPENFEVVFGQYISSLGTEVENHDRAHSQIIEELVAKGLLGLLAYLAIWGFAFHALIRAAKRVDGGERALILFAGAALTGYFVQSQSLFSSTVSSLLSMLLLAFAAYIETTTREPAPRRRRWTTRWRKGWQAAAAATAIATVAVGVFVHHRMWSGAVSLLAVEGLGMEQALDRLEQAIADFEPLANLPRQYLFLNAEAYWPDIRRRGGDQLRRVLELVDAQAPRAQDSEPENWRIHMFLARMYRAIATTEPEYRQAAQRHRQRLLALAPLRHESLAMRPPLPRPGPIRAPGTSVAGSFTLHWDAVAGTRLYRLQERSEYSSWVEIGDGPEPRHTVAGKTSGIYTYRVKACIVRYHCGPWTRTVKVAVGTDAGQGPAADTP